MSFWTSCSRSALAHLCIRHCNSSAGTSRHYCQIFRVGKHSHSVEYESLAECARTERVLNLLSNTLAGEPFTPAGAPHKIARAEHGPLPEHRDPHSVELALEILATFNFRGVFQVNKAATAEAVEHSLGEFIRDHVVRYVEDDSAEIRRAAALSCCQVLANDPVVTQTSNHAIKLVNEVLEKLLTLAIADPGQSRCECSCSRRSG